MRVCQVLTPLVVLLNRIEDYVMSAPSYLGKRRRNHPKELISSRYLPDAPGIRTSALDLPLPYGGTTSLGNSLDVMITPENAIIPFDPPEIETIDETGPLAPIITHRPGHSSASTAEEADYLAQERELNRKRASYRYKFRRDTRSGQVQPGPGDIF